MGGSRVIKTLAVLITLGYCSLLLYHSSSNLTFQELDAASRRGSPAAIQVSNLSIEPVTKASLNDSVQTKDITLDDIFISVKTTKNYQDTRLPIILKTWFQLAKNQTWFFTDTNNHTQQKLTNGHMINTKCPASHQRKHLCCKTSVEYDRFLESGKKWFCHFDDDNYVNVPRLVEVLKKYDHQKDWYLGRPSVNRPVLALLRMSEKVAVSHSFWFATFGAGVCISRSLALKLIPVAGGGKFISICEKIHLPDDVAMGFIIEHLVKHKLTVVPEFHSHLEPMKLIPLQKFNKQISFSYDSTNVVNVPGFDEKYDPTRLLSLHCFLFPHFKFCPR